MTEAQPANDNVCIPHSVVIKYHAHTNTTWEGTWVYHILWGGRLPSATGRLTSSLSATEAISKNLASRLSSENQSACEQKQDELAGEHENGDKFSSVVKKVKIFEL